MHNYKHVHGRQLTTFNKEDSLADLAVTNWTAILMSSNDINMTVDEFIKILSLVIKKHAPSIDK